MMGYDKEEVIQAAASYGWFRVHQQTSPICEGTGKEFKGPCLNPGCPGGPGENRFRRQKDFDELGGVHCRKCHNRNCRDGFDWIAKVHNLDIKGDFQKILQMVAEVVGVEPKQKRSKAKSKGMTASKDTRPFTDFLNGWDDTTYKNWNCSKPGITDVISREGVEKVGGVMAQHCDRACLRIPVIGFDPHEASVFVALRLNWQFDDEEPISKKTIKGCKPGYSGSIPSECRVLIKCEGYTDMLAVLSLDLPDDIGVITNTFGCSDTPKTKQIEKLASSVDEVWIVHDCDQPGQKGASKFAGAFANFAPTKNVVLPYEVRPAKGRDLRDFISDGNGFNELAQLAANATPVTEITKLPTHLMVDILDEKLNDNYQARKFIRRHEEQIRFVYSWKRWLIWSGQRWSLLEGDNRVGGLARQFAADLFDWAKMAVEDRDKDANQIASYAATANRKERIKAVVELSQYDDRVAISHDQLDSDPYLLNVQNGTIDLNTCEMRPHNQNDLLTQVANVTYQPGAECPLWLKTLDLVFDGDAELIKYVQTLFGYSLAGITDEHIMPICYGSGKNGKSTLWNTWFEILGDYAGVVSQDLILPNNKQHPTEIADLFGKRFIAVGEPDEGRSLAESKVKEMTGDRVMKARRMREDFWQFTPTHTFWLSTNHKPKISGTDEGIWRRVKLIPFTVDLEDVVEIDKQFCTKLQAEFSGIFNWSLTGWQRYQSEGLIEPDAVKKATSEYRDAEDTIGEFIRQTYVVNSSFITGATECFQAFQNFGGKMTQTNFGKEIVKRFERRRHTAGKYRGQQVYHGFGVLSDAS